MKTVQKSFISGLNFLVDDSQIAEDGYYWAINCRNRYGRLEPIKKHLEVTLPDHTIIQGGISVGNALIIFMDGLAYYNIDGSDDFINIPSFLMGTVIKQYHCVAIPASTTSYFRKLNNTGDARQGVLNTLDFKINGIPQGIIVQDGLTQPWFIQYDPINNIFTARVTKKYSDWQNSQGPNQSLVREYVPIGKQMIVLNNTLFMVSPDGKSMYRSITGRCMDFMINVDVNGAKQTSENVGGAKSLAQAFDFDDITYLGNCDIPNSFIWGTKRNTRIVTADYTNTLFDEPTFYETAKINVGIVNQFSFAQGLNDYVQIESSGVKSYNAVQQFKFKGNSSIFSSNLSRLIYNPATKKRIKQTECAVASLDDYLFFSIDTFWGSIIAVHDILLDKWVSLDFTDVKRVRQFLLVDTVDEDKMYAITRDHRLFRMFGSNDAEIPALKVRSFVATETDIEHKNTFVRFMFKGGTYDGKVFFREFVDDRESIGNFETKDLKVVRSGVSYPVQSPVVPNSQVQVENPSFNCSQGLTGKKISFIVKWTNDAELVEFSIETSEQQAMASQTQKDKQISDTYGIHS